MDTHKSKYTVTLFTAFSLLMISYSCETECTTRVDNMKIHAVVADTTTEAIYLIPGWYHSEFQDDQLNFSIEFDHYVGGQGRCNWVWENYPSVSTFQLSCSQTLYTETDTIFAFDPLTQYFNIETYEMKDQYVNFLITQKPDFTFLYHKEYYTFTATISTENNQDFEDSCIVKIVE